jgi:hypothetical protein
VDSPGFCTSGQAHLARMVNARFLRLIGLWFRNGGQAGLAYLAAAHHDQSKIYTESGQEQISTQIFREFSTI